MASRLSNLTMIIMDVSWNGAPLLGNNDASAEDQRTCNAVASEAFCRGGASPERTQRCPPTDRMSQRTLDPAVIPAVRTTSFRAITSPSRGRMVLQDLTTRSCDTVSSGQHTVIKDGAPVCGHWSADLRWSVPVVETGALQTCTSTSVLLRARDTREQLCSSPSHNDEKPVKVEDALFFVDQIKFKFEHDLQVYNEFLDIMKEFKLQRIGTQQVIQLVSSLFKDEPELIEGFNAFLPAGHKIDVRAMETNRQEADSTSSVGQRVSTRASTASSRAKALTLAPPAVDTQTPVDLDADEALPRSFNNAFGFMQSVKRRFVRQPGKYERFIELLYPFWAARYNAQNDSDVPIPSAQDLYDQVAELFGKEEDLLLQFTHFLGNEEKLDEQRFRDRKRKVAVGNSSRGSGERLRNGGSGNNAESGPSDGAGNARNWMATRQRDSSPRNSTSLYSPLRPPPPGLRCYPPKRPLAAPDEAGTSKKMKQVSLKDVSFAEAAKYGTLSDYAFFDHVRNALGSQKVYENFLRCLVLYNEEVICRSELIQLVMPFLRRHPELLAWFKSILGTGPGPGPSVETVSGQSAAHRFVSIATTSTTVPGPVSGPGFPPGKRIGASYCALPPNYQRPKCSGRTSLCRTVLNDDWVSFPTWSEGSSFVTSKKSFYEEHLYRCEDERFDLDIVIETNASTIRVLEGVQRKMARMSTREAAAFELGDTLGGTSTTIHQRAIKQIYGDKATDIIEGLKKKPGVAVPVVLRRLKAKEEEWRTAQKEFNRLWREQNEKYYWKSLDHQASTFKQNDLKNLRSKTLLNEIECVFEERKEQMSSGDGSPDGNVPHLMLTYMHRSVFEDAEDLFLHYIMGQTGINEKEKEGMKAIVKSLLPVIFFGKTPLAGLFDALGSENMEYSGPERVKTESSPDSNAESLPVSSTDYISVSMPSIRNGGKEKHQLEKHGEEKSSILGRESENPVHSEVSEGIGTNQNIQDKYTIFYGNSNWYLFLRVHFMLCERLLKVYNLTSKIETNEEKSSSQKDSIAVVLGLNPKSQITCERTAKGYYTFFLDLVKKFMDGKISCGNYEDCLRELLGIQAYIAFTLDKVVSAGARQLAHLASDAICSRCSQLFLRMREIRGAGGPCVTARLREKAERVYRKLAAATVGRGRNLFRITMFREGDSSPIRAAFELLEVLPDAEPPLDDLEWSTYVERFPNCLSTGRPERGRDVDTRFTVFLQRNLRAGRKRFCNPRLAREPPSQERGQLLVVTADSSQCRFDVSQYRMVFVVDRGQLLYRATSLRRAREVQPGVSARAAARFARWYGLWGARHVGKAQHGTCMRWFLGRGARIFAEPFEATKPPYRAYNKYLVSR